MKLPKGRKDPPQGTRCTLNLLIYTNIFTCVNSDNVILILWRHSVIKAQSKWAWPAGPLSESLISTPGVSGTSGRRVRSHVLPRLPAPGPVLRLLKGQTFQTVLF